MKTTVLYVRVPVEVKEWLDRLAEDSGLSLARTCEALLRHCRDRQVSIRTHVTWAVSENSPSREHD